MLSLKSVLISVASFVSVSAFAQTYNCSLTDVADQGVVLGKFTIDTATQANVNSSVEPNLAIGCVVFPSEHELLSCYIAEAKEPVKPIAVAAMEVGGRTLGLSGRFGDRDYNLTCLNQ